MLTFQEAIKNLYEVFNKYPFPTQIEGCPCCIYEKNRTDLQTLSSIPKNELDGVILQHYYTKAMSTWGTEEDFMYFFPRIFELELTNSRSPVPMGMDIKLIPFLESIKWRQTWPIENITVIEDCICAYSIENPEQVFFGSFGVHLRFFLSLEKQKMIGAILFEYLFLEFSRYVDAFRQNYEKNRFSIKTIPLDFFSGYHYNYFNGFYLLDSLQVSKLLMIWPITGQDYIHFAFALDQSRSQERFFLIIHNLMVNIASFDERIKKNWLEDKVKVLEKMFFDPTYFQYEQMFSNAIEQIQLFIEAT